MKKIKCGNIFAVLIGIICLTLFIYSIINIINWYLSNNKNNKIKNEINSLIKSDDDIDFKKLKKQNPDVVAYIKIKNTNIEYIVVKGKNNDYYLNHDFNKEYNKAGWIFANYSNKLDGNDKNITIFGHGRLDGSMFGTLKKTLETEWQSKKSNQIITFITEKEKSKYQVFSTYKIKVEDYYIKSNFDNDEFSKFIKKIKSRSNKDYKIKVTTKDQILTLSTCDTNNDYRIVLHAKKVK